MVRGPESTIYGSDAMTSTVQMWTATGSTRALRRFNSGRTAETSRPRTATRRSQARTASSTTTFLRDQFSTQGQGINDAYSNSLQGGNVGIRLSDRVAFRLRLRHSNNFTGVPVELVVQRQSRASARLRPVRAPEQLPGQRRVDHQRSGRVAALDHRLRVQPSAHQRRHLRRSRAVRYDDPSTTTRASTTSPAFTYQGIWTPRSWAQTTIGDTFEDENGFIHHQLGIVRIRRTAITHGLRLNNYLFAQESMPGSGSTRWPESAMCTTQASATRPCHARRAHSWCGAATRHFSGTRLRAAYAEGIKEPSFEQSFGITGTFPDAAQSQPAAGAKPRGGSWV